MGNVILPWPTISSLRHISLKHLGAETKSQKAQARYKYGPIFRMSVVPRATGPSSWNPRSPIFRFHKSLQPNAHSDLCTTPYFRFFRFSLFQPHRAHRERFILTDALMFIYFLAEVDVYIYHQEISVIIHTDDLTTTLQDPGLSPHRIRPGRQDTIYSQNLQSISSLKLYNNYYPRWNLLLCCCILKRT